MGKEYISRRDAIKRLTLTFLGTVIGGHVLESCTDEVIGHPTILPEEILEDASKDFFFGRLNSLLDKLVVDSSYDKENYVSTYAGYTILPNKEPALQQNLNFSRRNNLITYELTRFSTLKHHNFLKVEEPIGKGNLSIPSSWKYDSRLSLSNNQDPMYGSPIVGQAKVSGNKVYFTDFRGVYSIDIESSQCILSWNIIDVIQRIDLTQLPVTFETIDEYDIYSGLRTLDFYKSLSVKIGGKQLKVSGYILHGQGTLPTYLWVDSHQRLICLNKGMEVYLLKD